MEILGTFGSINYYDPAGPDVALNPATSTILSWTSTVIAVNDTQFGNEIITSLNFWGVGGIPYYGEYELTPNIVITDCP
jgi:hypothetical protein